MSRIRLVLLSLLAVLSVSAVASATAQAECSGTAPEHKCIWEFKRTEAGAFVKLEAGEEEVGIVEPDETTTFTLTAGTHEIKCTTVLVIVDFQAGGKTLVKRIWFDGCTLPNETTCKVKSKGKATAGNINVADIPDKLVERETSGGAKKNVLSDNFEQKLHAGTKEFVTLEFGTTESSAGTGKFAHKVLTGTCTKYPAETKVKGNVAGEVLTEELNFPSPELKGNTLEAFGEPAKFVGKIKVSLEEPGEYKGV
jgi:hypothetical protein